MITVTASGLFFSQLTRFLTSRVNVPERILVLIVYLDLRKLQFISNSKSHYVSRKKQQQLFVYSKASSENLFQLIQNSSPC